MKEPRRLNRPIYGAAVAVGLWLLTSLHLFRTGALHIYLDRPELGSFLLAGLPNSGLSWSLPLFGVIAAAAQACGAVLPLLLAVRLAQYLLLYSAGSFFRGWRGGFLALGVTAVSELSGAFVYDAEQSFYSLSLLALLCLLLRRSRADTTGKAVLSGLLAGVSLLVRSPLLFFPPALVVLGVAVRKSKAALKGGLIFLASSYLLLVPWGMLSRSITGSLSVLDSGRAASNLTAGALGAVYTVNGNPLALAGLGPEDSPAAFYLREAGRDPAGFIAVAVRRLLASVLFHPLLCALGLAAFLFARGGDRLFAFALPGYFILFHSLFPVEPRYFYPLLWLLPPLLAAPLGPPPAAEADLWKRGRGTLAVSLVLVCAAVAVDLLALAWPNRAARNSFDGAVPRWLSGDRTMRGLECGTAWVKGDKAAYLACLEGLASRFGDKTAACFLGVGAEGGIFTSPLPPGSEMECAITGMLREFELGRTGTGKAAVRLAYSYYTSVHSMSRGAADGIDKEIDAGLKQDTGTFWNVFVYRTLLRWQPEDMARILPHLAAAQPLDGRLRLLADALEEKKDRGSFGWRQLREWLAPSVLGVPQASLRGLWRLGASESARLTAAAAKKEKDGDSSGAEALLRSALELDLNPDTAEVYLALCRRPVGAARERRLRDCMAAAYGAYFGAAGSSPVAGAEAAFRAYELLAAAGRKDEAHALLSRTVDNAPSDWSGLAAAKAVLAGRRGDLQAGGRDIEYR